MFRNGLIQLLRRADGPYKLNQGLRPIIVRSIYAETTLGMDNYLSSRERAKSQFMNTGDKFRTKMLEFVDDTSSSMIFTDDLKNMVHLVEPGKADDISLVVKMLKKFHSQNKELRFGNFIFGPVVMRMFNHINDSQQALQAFNDKDLAGLFDQLISYQILLNMLYENEKYQDILDTFDVIKSRQLQGGRYPKYVIVLVFAACYKMNTPESYKYGLSLWKELNDVGHMPMRKSATFIAAQAITNNEPHIAIEILSTIKQQNYMTVRNLKVLGFAKLNRFDDAMPLLRSVLQVDDPMYKKQTFAKEVIEQLIASVKKSQNTETEASIEKICKLLQEQDHISEPSLDEMLCSKITSTSISAQRNERSAMGGGNFQRNDDRFPRNDNRFQRDGDSRQRRDWRDGREKNPRATSNSRPGLQDMY